MGLGRPPRCPFGGGGEAAARSGAPRHRAPGRDRHARPGGRSRPGRGCDPPSLGYAFWREGGLSLTRTVWTYAPAGGVLNSSGRVLLAWALISGEASAAVPVSQMSFVFTFVLAAPLFGEPITRRKLGGLAAAVLAVLALPGSLRRLP